MRFIDWIAWPAPPLIRLSIAEKHATVRVAALDRADLEADLGVVRAAHRDDLGQALLRDAHERLARERLSNSASASCSFVDARRRPRRSTSRRCRA